jgi:hypothetical protein
MLYHMRTTLTLDDDVATVLERLRKARGESLKDLVNEALREGLKRLEAPRRKGKPFRTNRWTWGRVYWATWITWPKSSQ